MGYKVKKILAIVVFGSLFIAGMAYLVMLLWNALIPQIFNISEITFLQALGLLALTRILFGGFGPGRFSRHNRWKGKWMRMSPEQREEFRKRWREHGHKKVDEE